MDKRTVYSVLGLLVILYLVGHKTQPEFVQGLRDKIASIWSGKSADHATADAQADQWEKHRQDVFAARVAESKRRAVAKYPSLAVADSEMNIRFVYRYQWMAKENNERLRNPNWPELLADDCAAAAQPGAKAAAAKPGTPGAHPSAAANSAVATR